MKYWIACLALLAALAPHPTHAEQARASIDADALAAAKKAVRASPDDLEAQLRYSAMLRAIFRFDEASEVMQDAAKRSPEEPRVWIELARLAALSGNRGAAGSHAQKALRLGDESGEASALLERLSAAVRILSRKSVSLPEGSPAAAIAPTFVALKEGRLDDVGKGIAAPEWADGKVAAVIAAYRAHLAPITGVDFAGYELAPSSEPGQARVRLLWKVSPARMDFAAIAELPAVYRALLPLGWAEGLAQVTDPAIREQAIASARKAEWTDVTLAAAVVEDGKIKALMVGDDDLFAAPLDKVATAGENQAGEQVGSALTPGEKRLRREMFRNRYGKSEPAEEGAYMYRQILFALIISALSALFLVWLVRREKRKSTERR